MLIEGAQHHFLFDVAHDLRADIGLLLVVGRFERGQDLACAARAVAAPLRPSTHSSIGSTGPKSRSIACVQSRGIPLLLGCAAGDVLVHQLRHHILAHALDRLGDVLRAHQVGALLIDHAALIVGDVVVFQQLFARIEVVLLDAPLRALDLPRQHAAFDGLARLHADAGHQRLHARRIAEDAHQIVFERQIEAARSGIALAAGAAAQLIVDAPRLVALGADDVQAAGGEHLLVPRCASPRGSSAAAASFGFSMASICVCGLPPSTMSVPRPAMLVAIVIAPGRPASATMCASRSCCLAFSTSCGIFAPCQQLREPLGRLDRGGADQHRLAALHAVLDVLENRLKLVLLGQEHQIRADPCGSSACGSGSRPLPGRRSAGIRTPRCPRCRSCPTASNTAGNNSGR